MQNQIEKLYQISKKRERIILGLMSGTSLDGLDIALCRFTGNGIRTTFELLHFETVFYEKEFKDELLKIFCKENVSLQQVCLMNHHIAKVHSNIINKILNKWQIKNSYVDCVASHGQTIYHAPKQKHQIQKFDNATLQIGDGDVLAVNTGILTISDFRQKHIAHGGTGAPLALYGDYFLLSSDSENRLLLNIGGIANFTYLSKNKNFEDVISTDTGPGNTLMDLFCKQKWNIEYDSDGAIAATGIVNTNLLDRLFENTFFNQNLPSSTGQEVFNISFLADVCQFAEENDIKDVDVLATLNFFTAKSIFIAIDQLIHHLEFSIYVSGGGWHNQTLINHLNALLPNVKIQSTQILGVHADAKEAILFALLANETLNGQTKIQQENTSKNPLVTMGKISFPR